MNLSGKYCLVTGASSGLGLAVSKLLAEKGAHTILMCRDKMKGENTLKEIKAITPHASLNLMICDLASINSIRNFIKEFKEKYTSLDVLFNNAAVMKQKRTVTADGFEMMFQVNYLAPFILTNEFIDLLKNSASPFIINLARPEYKVKLDMDDLQFSKKYKMWNSFFVTKLYLLLAGLEFSRRYEKDGITVSMIDPASRPFKSELGRDIPLVGWFKNLFSAPVDEAAENILFHIASDEMKKKNGKLFRGKQKWSLSDYWEDTNISQHLWSVTESLINNNEHT
jgi:NAD(P)-dependent dehydrogenase (short-subunit alcohol dehydrogenase family)